MLLKRNLSAYWQVNSDEQRRLKERPAYKQVEQLLA
jgi:hypothetical protein